MTQPLPPKKEVALALLERSNVDVYLDPRAKGVVVPPQFRKEPRLILKIGLNMPVPIPDLRLDDESMSCTLSFNRSPFYCVVPWSSVFAMVGEDGRGMVWPDDVPQELAVKVVDPSAAPRGEAASPVASAPAAAPARRGRAAPRDRGAAASGPGPGSAAGEEAGKKKRKKKDEGRPVLMAVPPPSPVSLVPNLPPSERDVAAAEGGRDAREPVEPRRSSGGGGREAQRDGVTEVPRAPQTPSSRPRQPPPPSQRRPDGGIARPKRELPPYLRVVK